MTRSDQQPKWLAQLHRYHRDPTFIRFMRVSGENHAVAIDRLQRQIAMSKAATKDGLLAQAQLLADLNHEQPNASLAQAIVDGIMRPAPDA